MALRQPQLSLYTPRTLRDAFGLSFTYREEVRWLIGTSPLLGLSYTHVPSDAQIIDARKLDDFRAHAFGEGTIRFGAFADIDGLQTHPLLLETFAERAEEVVSGQGHMNCSLCQYRVAIVGHEHAVGAPQEPHHHHVQGLHQHVHHLDERTPAEEAHLWTHKLVEQLRF